MCYRFMQLIKYKAIQEIIFKNTIKIFMTLSPAECTFIPVYKTLLC